MYNNVSNQFKEAVKSNAVTSTARITVYNSDDTTTLITGENIKTVKITDNCYNEGVIIGTTMSKEAEIEIINNNYDLADKEFDLELGIEISSDTFEYVPYGRYIIKSYEDTKSNNTYKIIAYDYMDKLNAKFEDTNAYPMTLQEFYESLATQYNVEIEAQELPNQDFNITEKPYFEGMSGRNVLSAIAQMFGSFAKFNRQNKIQMYLTNTTNEQISRSQMNSSLEVDKMYGPVNVVVLKLGQVEGENITLRDDESIALYGETTLTIEDNPFVYSQELRQLAIQGIYDRVRGFKYIPTTFNYKSPLYLDCGDTISVQLMNSDDYVSSIVLNQYIEVPSTRKSKCENKALTNTAVKQQFISADAVKSRRTELQVNKQESKINAIIQQQSTQGEQITTINANLNGVTTRVESTEENVEKLGTSIDETKEDITELDNKVNDEVSNLQAQIDGQIQFWNGQPIPTLNNQPAINWETEADRNNHRADIYTVIEDIDGELKQGKSYRFDKVGNTWTWVELTDNELSAVQALAQSKAKVFTTTPKPPYNVGDLWLKDKELYECIVAKDANGTYAVADWQKATKYTDDTVAYLAQATADKAINNQTITATTDEGKEFYLPDSADNVCKTVEIFGESTQEIRSGKNLCPMNVFDVMSGDSDLQKYDATTHTLTYLTDNTTQNSGQYKIYDWGLIVGRKYTLSFNIRGTAGKKVRVGWDTNALQITLTSDYVRYSVTLEATKSNEGIIFYSLSADNGGLIINEYMQFANIQIEPGEIATEYEEFGAMPSPDFPSEIESVSWKNLLDVSNVENKYIRPDGIGGDSSSSKLTNYIPIKANKTYIFSYDYETLITPTERGICLYNTNKEVVSGGFSYYPAQTKSISITPNEDGYIRITYDNNAYDLQFEQNSTPTFYVPNNHIVYKSIGKNFLNIPSIYELIGVQSNIELDLPIGNYVISASEITSTAEGNWTSLIILYFEDGTETSLYIGGTNANTKQVTLSKKVVKYNLYSNSSWSGSQGVTTTFKDLMISKEGGSYEPYKESITTMPLLHDMRSLPNGTRDTIYYKDGKWYDEQRVGQVILNGSEAWFGYRGEANTYTHRVFAVGNGIISANINANIMSDRFSLNMSAILNANENGIYCYSNNVLYIAIDKTLLTGVTPSDFKTWLSENNTEVIYELAEPIITEIIDPEMINALENIRTFKNITHITADAPSILTYYRDVPMVEEYETIANANKKYQTTTEKFAEQEVTNSSIRSSVSQINTTITNDLATKTALSTEIAQVNNSIDIKIEETEAQIQEVDGKVETLSEKVNDMSYNFGTQGLKIATSQDANNSLLDNTGIRVYNYNTLQAIFNYKGSGIEKLIVTGNAQIGYLRFVKSTKDYKKVTKIFHLDQLIENLEDLEV